jgi:uncharacterized BrkB/YihY/UPF0761 family membrane protein
MGNNQDDYSRDDIQKPKLKQKAFEIHRELTRLDIAALDDRRKVAGLAIYRFLVLLVENVIRTELPRRAASLTYTTILSLFPLLAVISSTASVFYTEEKETEFWSFIERQMLPGFAEQSRDIEQMSEREREMYIRQKEFTVGFRDMFANVSSTFRDSAGGVGLFGFLGLLIAAGILYSSIESVVNVTWQTGHRGRWTQTLTNFITVIVFAPIIIAFSVTASGFAVALLEKDPNKKSSLVEGAVKGEDSSDKASGDEPQAEDAKPEAVVDLDTAEFEEAIRNAIAEVEADPEGKEVTVENIPIEARIFSPPPSSEAVDIRANPIVSRIRGITTTFGFLLPLIPLLLNSIILGVSYAFLPKTRVSFHYALIGGFLAAVLWEIARYWFFSYVYNSMINRTIAGALGLSIVFLIWIYITWMILLSGNIIVFVLQNYRSLWSEKRAGEMILLDMRLLVAVMMMLGRRFTTKGGGLTQSEIRLRLGLRIGEFNQIIDRLQAGGYVAQMENDGWQVSRPPDQILVKDLLDLGCHMDELPGAGKSAAVSAAMKWLQEATVSVAGDMNLKELVEKKSAESIEKAANT